MSEEAFMLCDGAGCSKAVKAEVAVADGWWHVAAMQHDSIGESATFEVDLCPECCDAMFPAVPDGSGAASQ